MDVPDDIRALLAELDAFIEREIRPLEEEHPEYFDHRREFARTDVENGGAPRRGGGEVLVGVMGPADAAGDYRPRAAAAGISRHALPPELGGAGGTTLDMAVIREHLANKPLGLHSDLQTESAAVGNFPIVLVFHALGSAEQKELI